MKVQIGDIEYLYLKGYQEHNKYRQAFNKLSNDVFELSFEDWYKLGYWNDMYIPYTLFYKDEAVANVSVNVLDFKTPEGFKHCVQIGTVMTKNKFRGLGLSRFLMEQVLQEWDSKCDLIYLYANKSVLDLYPKFGFNHVKEYSYFIEEKNKPKIVTANKVKKLDMGLEANRTFVCEFIQSSVDYSSVSMSNNSDLVMFYCSFIMKNNIYHLKDLDTVIVAIVDNGTINLLGVFSKENKGLKKIINFLMESNIGKGIREVTLRFTPKNIDSFQKRENIGDDFLFIQKNRTKMFEDNSIMFPVLSHA
jgi:GNAT superfamily N-acetyltransferase